MIRFLFALLLLGSLALAGGSHHFIWKVSGKGSDLWLLGSIHMAKSSLYPLDAAIEKAYDESTSLAVEIDINQDTTAMQVAKRISQNGIYPKGDSLARHIAPQLQTRLDSLLEAWDIPLVTMRNMRPWFVTMQIGAMAVEREGMSAADGIDLHFLKRAAASGKPVYALETVAEQADLFVSLADSLQEAMLQLTLDEVGDAGAAVDSMFLAWNKGDTLGMETLALDGMGDEPRFAEFRKRLYTDRNVHMADHLEAYLRAKKRVFVIVGSAHLVGPGSVVRILRERGFLVTQY